jgi:hypothetical protein
VPTFWDRYGVGILFGGMGVVTLVLLQSTGGVYCAGLGIAFGAFMIAIQLIRIAVYENKRKAKGPDDIPVW